LPSLPSRTVLKADDPMTAEAEKHSGFKPARIHYLAAALIGLALVGLQLGLPGWPIPLLLLLGLLAAGPFFPGAQLFLPLIRHGPRTEKVVALTFDDGPDPRVTPAALELLDRWGSKAAFFLVGQKAQANPELVREILERGHEVGNHSYSHDPLLMLRPFRRLGKEIDSATRALSDLGVRPLAFRPPAGITNPKLGRALRRRGLFALLFDCRGIDFGNRRLHGLAARILKKARPGSIILLHDRWGGPEYDLETWQKEVERILEGLAERGLAAAPLSRVIGRPVMEQVSNLAEN